MNSLRVAHECDRQMDGRTDIVIANTALNHVVRPKTLQVRNDRLTDFELGENHLCSERNT